MSSAIAPDIVEQDQPGYQPAFEALFNSVYSLPACDLEGYFSEVQVQLVPRYAYGEDIAVRAESGDRLSLTRSYELFLDRIIGGSPPWETPERHGAEGLAAPVKDENWLQQHRSSAEAAH